MHNAVAAAHDAVVSAYGEIDPTVLADHLEVTAHWPGLAADPAGDVAGYFQEAVQAAHSVYGS